MIVGILDEIFWIDACLRWKNTLRIVISIKRLDLDSDFITCNSAYYQSLLDSFSKSKYDMLVFINEDTQIIDNSTV